MFYYAKVFNANIASWNTAKVTRMDEMFEGAATFNQNIASWKTDEVAYMWDMFHWATAFNQKLCKWLENPNFPNNIQITDMFWKSGCDVTDNPSNSAVCQSCITDTPSYTPSYSYLPTISTIPTDTPSESYSPS